MIFREDRLVECSIFAVGRNEEELKYTDEEQSEEEGLE